MAMRGCGVPVISGPECDGHLGQFGDCLAEVIYDWTLDEPDWNTGDGDFEGYLSMVIIDADTTGVIDPDGVAREVAVPAGNYLLWKSTTGRVTLGVVDTMEGAREIFEYNQARYHLWDRGCDPNDPSGHERCADFDRCLVEVQRLVEKGLGWAARP